jgi:hypothetical protein
MPYQCIISLLYSVHCRTIRLVIYVRILILPDSGLAVINIIIIIQSTCRGRLPVPSSSSGFSKAVVRILDACCLILFCNNLGSLTFCRYAKSKWIHTSKFCPIWIFYFLSTSFHFFHAPFQYILLSQKSHSITYNKTRDFASPERCWWRITPFGIRSRVRTAYTLKMEPAISSEKAAVLFAFYFHLSTFAQHKWSLLPVITKYEKKTIDWR